MNGTDRGDIVGGVLDRMEHHARIMRLAIMGAAAAEGLLLLIAIISLDWSDRTHIVLFLFAVLGYTIAVLGFVAMGAHISRVGARVVAALDQHRRSG